MARLSRFFLPGQPLHVIHRGKGGRRVFFGQDDYAQYRDWLAEAAAHYRCAVHAYVLLPDRVELLVTPKDADSLPRTLQSLGRRYTRHVNAARRRTGTLWEGRYRAAPIEGAAYLLDCARYIESRPVGEGLARRPQRYPWSSYHANALGVADPVVSEHRLYRDLAGRAGKRQKAYRRLFDEPLDEGFVEALRAATNGGWALGSDRFKERIAAAAGRRVAPLPRGRPRKTKSAKARKLKSGAGTRR